jgi:hypothetical protein
MTDTTFEPLFTDDELRHMCRSGTVRMTEALTDQSAAEAWATYHEMEDMMRAFCTLYLDWLALTDEYVFEVHGHQDHAAAMRPERVAELTIRTGMSLDDLLIGQELVAGPENRLTAEMREAIEAGDHPRAMRTWHEVVRILRDVHDLRRDLISDLLGWIYREHGAEGLLAAQEYCAPRGWWKESMPRDFALDPKQRLSELVFFLTVGAFSEQAVIEEEDRWIVQQLVCGNCGRQVRDRYGDSSWGLDTVTEQGPLTFGQPELTIYQTHLAVIHHMYAIDLVGAPWPAFECAGMRAGQDPCRLIVYKEPSQTAPEYYEVVGRQVPARDPA